MKKNSGESMFNDSCFLHFNKTNIWQETQQEFSRSFCVTGTRLFMISIQKVFHLIYFIMLQNIHEMQ